MLRFAQRLGGVVCLAAGLIVANRGVGHAVSLDKDGSMKLGVRSYVNARIGGEHTNETVRYQANGTTEAYRSGTFPVSAAGHLRQNRFFVEAEFDHDLSQLQKDNFGPLALLNNLPFKIRGFKYHLVFRGEYDGVYDWGPSEFSTAQQFNELRDNHKNPATGGTLDVVKARQRLRKYGSDRERLFQAYTEASVGDLFVRIGRQILSWGETDGFRLIDNINPVDSSFGGFLVSLDERRVPLDMLRLQYNVGDMGPISDAFLEFYGAIDTKVGFSPGTPAGSPWTLPNLGEPSRTTKTFIDRPRRNFSDMRGGGRAVWSMFDATFSLAHYYTYVDTPALQVFVKPGFPVNVLDPDSAAYIYDTNGEKFSAEAIQSAPLVQISGLTTSFAIPQIYSIFRSEVAYFKDEPRFRQSEIDPFIFHYKKDPGTDNFRLTDPNKTTGGRRVGDSFNAVVGLDINQYIRFLNPNQTFFISTQLFYKHLIGAAKRGPLAANRSVQEGEVLPVPEFNTSVNQAGVNSFGAVEPNLIHQPEDTFLHTLLIATSYMSGQVNPYVGMFYDWGGALVVQPGVGFSRDPFRFFIDYSYLDAGRLKGGSGTSLLKDRDNVQFRFEYVI